MDKTFSCSCYKCGHNWQHDSQNLQKNGGAKCPSCGLWLPIADDAVDRVDFIAAMDKAGGAPFVSGKDFGEAVQSMDQEKSSIANSRKKKKWWQFW